MEEIPLEEILNRFPQQARDTAAHLRVGVLGLPGVAESGFRSPETGNYCLRFYIGEDTLVEAHSHEILRVIIDFTPEDAQRILDRKDLSGLELEPWGREGVRRLLAEILEAAEEEDGLFRVDLAVSTQDDIRSVTKLVYAKYDLLMTR